MKRIREVALVFFMAILLMSCVTMGREYQRDADIIRLRHLDYYGALIEEFHAITGCYPLQGDTAVPDYVYIATPQQLKYIHGAIPNDRIETNLVEFRAELEQGLGRNVVLKFNPQQVPTGAPNFYGYMIQNESYLFFVHLYNAYSFTRVVARNNNIVELTDIQTRKPGMSTYLELLDNEDFQTAMNTAPTRSDWFLHLEEKYK